MPEPQQHRIRATSATYTTAHSNAGLLTHWARAGTEPATSWFLVRFVNHCAMTGTPVLPLLIMFFRLELFELVKSKESRTWGGEFHRRLGREKWRHLWGKWMHKKKGIVRNHNFHGIPGNKNLNYLKIAFLFPKSVCVCVCVLGGCFLYWDSALRLGSSLGPHQRYKRTNENKVFQHCYEVGKGDDAQLPKNCLGTSFSLQSSEPWRWAVFLWCQLTFSLKV